MPLIYSIPYSGAVPAPTVTFSTNNAEICASENFQYLNVTTPPGYPATYGLDYYATGGVLVNNVANTSAVAPYHTTNTSVTFQVGINVYGIQDFRVRMNDLNCPASPYVGYQKRIGVYNSQDISITGYSTICPNQTAFFGCSPIGPDVLGFQWTAPNGWSNSGSTSPSFAVTAPSSFSYSAITLRYQNRCGWTNMPRVYNLSRGNCFAFNVSPNPTTSTVSVTDLDPESETSVALIDKNNSNQKTVTRKAKNIDLDVSDVPNGIYFVMIKQNDVKETHQIVVKH
ncbi:MAG: T9SS type A sorting domain-containing protein [Chryseolinea sp.]